MANADSSNCNRKRKTILLRVVVVLVIIIVGIFVVNTIAGNLLSIDQPVHVTLNTPISLPTTAPSLLPRDNSCAAEILAPSDYSDPKDAMYSAQYCRLNWMIAALFYFSQSNQASDFPGANFPAEDKKDNTIFWTDIFKPMGNCTPTKTVKLTGSIDWNNNLEIAQFLRDNIKYQPDFRRDLDARKVEWKSRFNISNRDYVSFHMRRTDKVGTESLYCSAIQYLSYMLLETSDWPRNIFIMTDDPRAVEEVKAFVPNNGLVAVHSGAKFSRAVRGNPVDREWVIDSFAELEIAAEATAIVVQSSSHVATSLNIFRYARNNYNNKPMIATDYNAHVPGFWDRMLNLRQLSQVCPLVGDLELKAPAMACNMPWWRAVVSIKHDDLFVIKNHNDAGVDKITSTIENLLDSIAVLAQGLIPFKFDPHDPFLDGMCGTLCPTTVEISADKLGAGWRNLTVMEHFLHKMNSDFAVPSTRTRLLEFTCEKLSLSNHNYGYGRPYAVCTWINVKRVLLFTRLILKPVIRQEVDKAKSVIKSKHSLDSPFAVFQVDSSTLSELGDEVAARKYWSMFLEAKTSAPCCIKKIWVMGNSTHAADRLISSIHALDGGALINGFPRDILAAAVLGEGRYTEGSSEQLIMIDSNSNNTTTTATSSSSLFFEVWASMEVIAQADIVIMDDLSGVGKLVSLMRLHYQKPSALSIRNNVGDNKEY